MTPKEKAEELVNNFLETIPFADANVYEDWKKEMKNKAKECALMAVDFAMNSKYSFQPMHGGWVSGKLYYEEVKQEIEKL